MDPKKFFFISITCLSLVNASNASHAAEGKPDYVGRWIDDQGTCDATSIDSLGPGTYVFTPGHRYDADGVCDIKITAKQGKGWELDQACEGDAQLHYSTVRTHWSLVVAGNKMTVIITDPGEKPEAAFTLDRCVN
jgi:hypothetical protein